MLNGWTILFGILYVLFVTTAFGQEQSDSHIIKVTKEIDVAKLNENVENLTKTVADLTKTVEKLDKTVGTLNTTVGELQTTVARIDERTKGISSWQYVILAGIFGPLLLSLYDRVKQNNESKTTSTNTAQESVSAAAPTQVTQVNQNEVAATNPTQVSEDKAAPTPTSPSRLPDGKEELEEYLKLDSHATKETV